MSTKATYYLAAAVGGAVGGFVPELWHADFLSLWGIIFSGIGGMVGIWLAYKFVNG